MRSPINQPTRRRLLVAFAMVASMMFAGVGSAGVAAAQGSCAGTIPDARIAVQLFAMRSAIFGDGVEPTMDALGDMGYQAVETAFGTFGLELGEFEVALKSNGIRPVASHGSLNLDNWDDTLRDAKRLNQRYVGSGGFGGPGIGSLADTLQTAANLNILGERAAARGMKVQAHNHAGEFTTQYMYDVDGDGTEEMTSAWEIIANNVDPEYVSLQLDIHWIRTGVGLDNFDEVIRILETYQDVIDTLHVKDTNPDGSMAYLGEGTTDWVAVFQADPTIRYYIAEHDNPADALEYAEGAFDYLDCIQF